MAQLDGMRRKYADESPNAPPRAAAARYSGETPIPKSSAISRFASFTPRAPTMAIATVEQLLRGGGEQVYARWPSISKGASASTPTITGTSCNTPVIIGRDFDPEENPIPQLRASPSVLARVKEKAERWRRTLSVQRTSSLDPNFTPSWGVSLDDIDDHFSDDDPDNLGPPMSELAPKEIKEAAKQHPGAVLVVTDSEDPNPNQASAIAVKLSPNLTVLAPTQHLGSGAEDQVRDKGVSVKEYIMHKFEPGDDEKALSQMIVQAMSPRGTCTATTDTTATPTVVGTVGSNVVGAAAAVASVATTTGSNVVGAASAVASAATTTGSNVVGAVASAASATGSNVVGAAAAVASTTGSNVVGVVGKVRGAVNSLLLTSLINTPTPDSSQPAEVSKDAHEAVEKENQERIPKTN